MGSLRRYTFSFIAWLFLLPMSVLTGSHSLTLLFTYIKGDTQFPVFSATVMLDDIIVGYYNSETKMYVARGNTTDEDDAVDPNNLNSIIDHVRVYFTRKLYYLKPTNHTESHVVFQVMSLCELSDDKPGRMITQNSFKLQTVDELVYFDGNFTYNTTRTNSELERKPFLELSMRRHETLYYPACIQTLKSYLKKRGTQVKKRVKPRVRLIQKASDFGGFVVSCLATGFYPRHINLTLLRDGQPVSDHEVTGGDLLPNGDGTYQMRKSLEIRAEEKEKHKYTCSAKLLNLDNKLDIDLEFDHNEPFKSVIPLIVMVLVLMVVVAAVIWKKQRADSPRNCEYSTTSSSEEHSEEQQH